MIRLDGNVMELTLKQALHKGVEAQRAGHFKESKRLYRIILQSQPKHPEANHNMGVLAVEVGKAEDALPFFKIALKANPSIGQFWLSSIDALIKVNRLTDAKTLFKQAKANGAKGNGFDKIEQQLVGSGNSIIKLDPSQDHLQQLITLYSQGRLLKALEEANKLLQQFPSSHNLYNVIGVSNNRLGLLEKAAEAFKKAIALRPDNIDAYNNLGLNLNKQGKSKEAIIAFNKALTIKPSDTNIYYNMALALKGFTFTRSHSGLQKVITSILDCKTYVRPSQISNAVISLLKFEPSLKKVFEKCSSGELNQSIREITINLSKVPLLLKFMSVSPIADLQLESALTYIRSSLLLTVANLEGFPGVLRFQTALALQCFTNEYLYNYTDIEAQEIESLENLVKDKLLNDEQPSPQSILCLAAYKALYQYEWCNQLRVISDIEEVYTRQILEPQQEHRLKLDIPALEGVIDKVSSNVQDFYETNPYPRWINLRLALHPSTISKFINLDLKLRLSDQKIKELKAPDILIAGCGTGQHSITTASRLKDSKVLAVDLSLTSLAYAKRKTEELGLQNIDYMHADILNLNKLGKKFDIIESSGVLHHMDNPMAGWRVLTNCLKSGGLMKIGLYSELARQHISKLKKELTQSGVGASDIAVKSFRKEVINSDNEHHKSIINTGDFYSLSALRDLLFHVQEHHFTLPQIQNSLTELGLTFCGFDTENIVQQFKLKNDHKDDPYDLSKWNSYEHANPTAFFIMYQFWCQKL